MGFKCLLYAGDRQCDHPVPEDGEFLALPSLPAAAQHPGSHHKRRRLLRVRSARCTLVQLPTEHGTCQSTAIDVASIVGSRPSDHYFRSVCWFVCLSVCRFVCLFVCAEFFSAVRFRSNLDICYMSGSSCVP